MRRLAIGLCLLLLAASPATAANWPNVNAGLLRIGRDFGTPADYVCRSITVDIGATLITRVNCFVENYGQMRINGTYEMKNSAPGAFQNKPGGGVLVSGTVRAVEN